jgi:hypothetical protein
MDIGKITDPISYTKVVSRNQFSDGIKQQLSLNFVNQNNVRSLVEKPKGSHN